MADLVDTGNRTDYGTGALRDMPEDKGRCDLLPLDIVSMLTGYDEFKDIQMFQNTGDVDYLVSAVKEFCEREKISIAKAILEVSHQYEDGAKKYGPRNWEKGLPVWNFVDSGVRHLLKFSDGMTDEPHDRAFIWNMIGAIWTTMNKPELCEYPINLVSNHEESEQEGSDNSSSLPFDSPLDASPDDFPVATEVLNSTVVSGNMREYGDTNVSIGVHKESSI